MNHRSPFFVAASALCLSASLLGCQPPKPAPHATLAVGETGAYQWQGQPLDATQLPGAVQRARESNGSLVVELDASPKAPIAAVQLAVEAVRSAKATLAFTHPLESLEQRTKGVGESADIR